MSEFHVVVARIGKIEKHPNADTLAITHVLGDYPVIVKQGSFQEGDLAAYVPVDALVPIARDEFAFLASEAKGKDRVRIKAKCIRGTFSMGLLVPAPSGALEGANVQGLLGVEKYVPPSEVEAESREPKTRAQIKAALNAAWMDELVPLMHETGCTMVLIARESETRAPKSNELKAYEDSIAKFAIIRSLALIVIGALSFRTSFAWSMSFALLLALVNGLDYWRILNNRKKNRTPEIPHYDIEGLRRYKNVFTPGEPVWITEKIHGCNARYVHTGHKLFCGSRTMFREGENVWTKVAKDYHLEDLLKRYPNVTLYGEIYGDVQDLKYGVSPQEKVKFAAFDLYDVKAKRWYDVEEFNGWCLAHGIPVVPTLYYGPWDPSLSLLAEGTTTMPGADHCREGIVVKPLVEAHVHGLGRKFLKLAGETYHLRKSV